MSAIHLSSALYRPDRPQANQLTTVVDGTDLRIPPDQLREDPVERTAVSSGLFGKVHFLWPEELALNMLTVSYQGISREHTRRLLAALGPRTLHDKTLSFVRDQGTPGTVIPGAVTLRVTYSGQGLWNVSLETPARPNLYAGGTT